MRGALAALVSLVLLASLGGCGEEGRPVGSLEPTRSPSPSAPPGLDTSPPTEPDQEPTRASAEEFGSYLALLVQHAIRIRDVEPVIVLARDQATCTTCGQLGDFIEGMKKEGVWEVGPDLEIRQMRARPTGDLAYAVAGRFAYPPAEQVDLEGRVVDSLDGGRNFVFRADVSWSDVRDAWQIGDYTFLNKDG